MAQYKMFRFINYVFFTAMMFIGCNALNVNLIKCVLMNNQGRKLRPKMINIKSNEPSFYPQSTEVNKCSGSCNNINDAYVKLYVPDVKNADVKVFNLMSKTNATRDIKWHETCKCKSRLDASGCNNNQRWIDDKCRCEYKELIGKGRCDKRFISNSSNCECECVKSCDIK